MQAKQKNQQFKSQIRRKSKDSQYAHLRAQFLEQFSQIIPESNQIKIVQELLKNTNQKNISENIDKIKRFSQNKLIISTLKDHFQNFYTMLVSVDQNSPSSVEKRYLLDDLYSNLSTILINIVSLEEIQLHTFPNQHFFDPLIANLKIKKRQISTLWLIANIIYRQNKFGAHLFAALSKIGLSKLIKNRIQGSFESDSDLTIFYYFCGSVIANLHLIDKFSQYKQMLALLESISQINSDECYWYLLDGLILHARYFKQHNYECLQTQFFKRAEWFFKNKKSKYILKYLDIYIALIKSDVQVLNSEKSEESIQKIIANQYQRYKSHIVKILEFCLDNRSPQVKQSLCKIGFLLISVYHEKIDLLNEYFYLQLAEEIRNFQKIKEKGLGELINYLNILIIWIFANGLISKNRQNMAKVVHFIQETNLIGSISAIIKKQHIKMQIIVDCLEIITHLLQPQEIKITQLLKTNRYSKYYIISKFRMKKFNPAKKQLSIIQPIVPKINICDLISQLYQNSCQHYQFIHFDRLYLIKLISSSQLMISFDS